MRRESPIMPEARVERPLLVWQPLGGTPVEYEVWPERPVTIGRDGTNTVVIESPFVSKTHAVIRYTAGEYAVEDLQSANGTRVNGAPIAISILSPGDVLEVGDQRFLFMDGQQAHAASKAGLSKNVKLALAALGTLGVLGVVFAMILSSSSPPAQGQSASSSAAGTKSPAAALPAAAPPVDVNSAAVREVLDRAREAGIKPADALYDEAGIAFNSGRLREAAQLFGAVLERDPKNESAVRRFEEAKTRWAQAIADHAGEAERAFDELRFNDAGLEWGKVLQLTDATDKRHALAQEGIDRARQRSPR